MFKKLNEKLEKMLEGATAAVTLYFDHDPKYDYNIIADIETIEAENKIVIEKMLIADYYNCAIAQDGGYIQFDVEALKDAFVKDYNEYEKLMDDPDITKEDIEEIHLSGYDKLHPLVYGAGSWVGVSMDDGQELTWEKCGQYLPEIEVQVKLKGQEDSEYVMIVCDGVYHASEEVAEIVSDVEAADKAQSDFFECIKMAESVIPDGVEKYAVQYRDMHTAIHNLLICDSMEKAQKVLELCTELENFETEDEEEYEAFSAGICDNITELIENKFEINYRDVDDEGMYDDIYIINYAEPKPDLYL